MISVGQHKLDNEHNQAHKDSGAEQATDDEVAPVPVFEVSLACRLGLHTKPSRKHTADHGEQARSTGALLLTLFALMMLHGQSSARSQVTSHFIKDGRIAA